jgi:hypothetical protein
LSVPPLGGGIGRRKFVQEALPHEPNGSRGNGMM